MTEHTYTLHLYYDGHRFNEFLVRDDWNAETIVRDLIRIGGGDPASLKPDDYRSMVDPDYSEWQKQIRLRARQLT